MIRRTAVVLISLLVSSSAQPDAFYTYQSWSAMTESSRAAYISGAYDSLVTFIFDEQTGRMALHYANCIKTAKMTNFQLAANVLNFAKDKPQLHTGPVQGALLTYLIAACGEPPTK